jgi:hypothetical protein
MSNSSGRPKLSVIVASNGVPGSVEQCLAALGPQLAGAEVLVYEPKASPAAVRGRYPFARFFESGDALVPELWRDGIDGARGEFVALTISPMTVASDWVVAVSRLMSEADAVGGAIEPGDGLRVRDWAEYFSRYARDMLPFEVHECVDLPGDNAAYRKGALEPVSDSFRDGFWEPVVHRALRAREGRLLHTPELVARQGRSAGVAAFTRQRLRHGRLYGRQRGERFSTARNVAGVGGALLVPFLMTFRVLREVAGKRRHRVRALVALPLVFYFATVWAVAEARGHLEVVTGR